MRALITLFRAYGARKAVGRLVERNAVREERQSRRKVPHALGQTLSQNPAGLRCGCRAARSRALVELGIGKAKRVAHDADQNVYVSKQSIAAVPPSSTSRFPSRR